MIERCPIHGLGLNPVAGRPDVGRCRACRIIIPKDEHQAMLDGFRGR